MLTMILGHRKCEKKKISSYYKVAGPELIFFVLAQVLIWLSNGMDLWL